MSVNQMNVNQPIPSNFGDTVDRHLSEWKDQIQKIRAKFGSSIEEVRMPKEYPTEVPIIYVAKSKIIEVIAFLKSEIGFEYGFLADLTATDEESEPRFEIIYNLMSKNHGSRRIRVKTKIKEGEECPTLCGVWTGANWLEREVYDMFGVRFTGHPDLRRILMDARFVGHPLRKDYPLRGYQIFPTAMEADLTVLENS